MVNFALHLLRRDRELKEEYRSMLAGGPVNQAVLQAWRLDEPWGSMAESVERLKADWIEQLEALQKPCH